MTGKNSSTFAGGVALAVSLLLQGCGGGGGAKTVSEALVPDAAGCRIQAKVDTGDEPDLFGGSCLVFVSFQLFDAAGNKLEHETLDPTVLGDLRLYPPGKHVRFDLRICRGERLSSLENPPGTPIAFLVPDADHCPEGTVFPAFWGDVRLKEPLQEVSCDELSRVDVEVGGC
jgi:hypothetical protein